MQGLLISIKVMEKELGDGTSGAASREKLRYKSPTSWFLFLSFTVSLITLLIYLAEANFSDEALYFLLIIIRYSSFMVCLCALYKIAMHIYGLFRGYKFRIKRMVFLLGLLFYGISVIIFESFMVVISRGNG